MKTEIDAVLFDLDGVVFDSCKAICRAVNSALSDLGHPPDPFEVFRQRPNNRGEWYLERGMVFDVEASRDLFYEYFKANDQDYDLVPGIREVLEKIREHRVPCGIVSAARTERVTKKLEEFGIAAYFHPVFSGNHDKCEAIVKACRVLEVEPARTLFVGDLVCDVRDGKEAGVMTVLFAPHTYQYVREADYHITDMRELLPIVGVPLEIQTNKEKRV